MKKLLAVMILFALLFSVSGCCTRNSESGHVNTTADTKIPGLPEVYAASEDCKVPLHLGGYTWSYSAVGGTGRMFNCDQSIRPLPVESMETLRIVTKDLLDGLTIYAVNNSSITVRDGAQICLGWQVTPDFVECTFWPADYNLVGTGIKKNCETDGFTANLGNYIYEINAVWNGWVDNDVIYRGEAVFYIHVIVESPLTQPGDTR